MEADGSIKDIRRGVESYTDMVRVPSAKGVVDEDWCGLSFTLIADATAFVDNA